MSASVFESSVLNRLFPTGETGRLFTDSAAIRAIGCAVARAKKIKIARGAHLP